ncbi:MAG: hypothetical protein E7429_06820 [Ruminococcaceae bacterium]|nr:hypothetical protein [Oscillospiraceae bacterium]
MERSNEMENMDVLKQMYAILCGGMDDALTLLEQGDVPAAQKTLLRALETAEERYIDALPAADDPANVLDTSRES